MKVMIIQDPIFFFIFEGDGIHYYSPWGSGGTLSIQPVSTYYLFFMLEGNDIGVAFVGPKSVWPGDPFM